MDDFYEIGEEGRYLSVSERIKVYEQKGTKDLKIHLVD